MYTKILAKTAKELNNGEVVEKTGFHVAAVVGNETFVHFVPFKSEEYAEQLKSKIDATAGFTPAGKPEMWTRYAGRIDD